jgi:phenylalanyl-tRNA synthetase beta chain
MDLPRVVAVFDLDLDAVIELLGDEPRTIAPLSPYPAATQDISLVVGSEIPAGDVRSALAEGAGELLEDIRLTDVYAGDAVEEGMRSLTFALRFRAMDRTLTQAEATESKEAGLAVAAKRFGATLRG